MRITIGQLRRVIREVVEEEQLSLNLGRLGVPRAHRHAVPPDPPLGYELDTSELGTGSHVAFDPSTGKSVRWDEKRGGWVPQSGRRDAYSGGYVDHDMDAAVGGRHIGDSWRAAGRGW